MRGILLADGDPAALTALGIFVTNVVTGLVTAAVMLLRFRNESRKQARKDSIDEWRELLAEEKERFRQLVDQGERKDKVIEQYQQVIGSLTEDHADCREETAALRQAVDNLYDWLCKVWPPDRGVPPEMPKIPHRERPARSEYLLRQAEQSALLVKQADSAIIKPGDAAPQAEVPRDGGQAKPPV